MNNIRLDLVCYFGTMDEEEGVPYGIMARHEMCVVLVFWIPTESQGDNIRMCAESDRSKFLGCASTKGQRRVLPGPPNGWPMPVANNGPACVSHADDNGSLMISPRESPLPLPLAALPPSPSYSPSSSPSSSDNTSTTTTTATATGKNEGGVWVQVLLGFLVLGLVLGGIAYHAIRQRKPLYSDNL